MKLMSMNILYIQTMDNIELLKYYKELRLYRKELTDYYKRYTNTLRYTRHLLKDRIDDLECTLMFEEDERLAVELSGCYIPDSVH